jgi:hypothetical protein
MVWSLREGPFRKFTARAVAYLGPTGRRGTGQRGSDLLRTSRERFAQDLGPTYSISKIRD